MERNRPPSRELERPPELERPEMRLRRIYERVVAKVAAAREGYPLPDPAAEVSRDNLLAYLVLREEDLFDLQLWLAEEGLSSLGRLEGHVLAGLRSVLRHLSGEPAPLSFHAPTRHEARSLLEERSRRLLGRPRPGRATRIMVTLDAAYAHQHDLLEELLARGMDIARINTAHDAPAEWEALITALRQAEARLERRGRGTGRRCRVLMDLAGPKIRTGALRMEPRPLKLSVPKNSQGKPARRLEGVLDSEAAHTEPDAAGAPGRFVVALASEPGGLRAGDTLRFEDARGRDRSMTVLERVSATRVRVALERTAVLFDGLELTGPGHRRLRVRDLLPQPVEIRLDGGDRLRIYRDAQRLGHPADAEGPAGVSCTLPEALASVRAGHRVFLDDGRIEAEVGEETPDYLELRIQGTRGEAVRLAAEKGLNFPDSALLIPAFTPEDREHLRFVAEHADAVGLSFAHSAEDLQALSEALDDLGKPELGVIAKVETRAAIHHLGRMLLTGLQRPHFGVMIARGDLAVEIGFENLALIQEDILCLCEAAHVPVVWATQVLETLAKTGLPARAEITDAAMGQRAECVMLNKGPHVADAVEVLAELLSAEERHRVKKRQVFREFTAQHEVF